jgi:hypothetical protein
MRICVRIKEKIIMLYEKRFIDESGNYEIWYCPENGMGKQVLESQDLYTVWLAEGNEPETVAYVAPVVVIPSTEQQIDALWTACKAYQQNRIDDAGIAVMYRKADAGGTKATAVVSWVETLWNDYYVRRETANSEADSDYDFSNNSELPYDFYEAYAEEISA